MQVHIQFEVFTTWKIYCVLWQSYRQVWTVKWTRCHYHQARS